MVKTSPSNAGDAGSFPDWGAEIPYASWPKEQNIKHRSKKKKTQNQYCNKLKTLKMFHIKKKKLLKKPTTNKRV